MGKKLTTGIILILLFCISGCAGFNTGQTSSAPVSTPAQPEIPTDTEIIEGMKTGKTPAGGKTIGQQDEDILELKHWKYGSERAQPPGQQVPDQPVSPQLPQQPQSPIMDELGNNWETVSIPILSQEEIEKIIEQLIDSRYIRGPVTSELEFRNAIRDFQRDNSLPVTGKLDGPTRELLRAK